MINSPSVSPDVTFYKSLHSFVNVILGLPFLLLLSVVRTVPGKDGNK